MGKSKRPVSKLKTVTRLATHGKVKLFLKERKRRILENQLKNLCQQLIKKGDIDQTLLNFIRDINPIEKQIATWKELLSREDLTPNNLYEISAAIDDELLKSEVRRKYVAIASDDELSEIIVHEEKVFQEMAWQELCQRIQRGRITKSRARQILFKVFEGIPRYRIKTWDILKYLEPTDKELQHLLDLPFMETAEWSKLRNEIERLIRKKPKKKKNLNQKLISQIKKIEEKLAKLKEG